MTTDDDHRTQLTRRERGIAALVADGLTDRAIAARLRISERTVEGHVLSIRNRLGLANRTQIAAWHVRRTGSAGEPPSLVPGNLPAQLTSFVGRRRELAAVSELLRSTRLLTIAGTGGCGKTRLAVEIAGGLLDRYAAGAWFVDLAPLADPGDLARTVAAAMSAGEGSADPLDDIVAAATRGRRDLRCLLLLDSCEHLVEACGRLAEALLRDCGRLTVLCTCREPLRVAGEVVFRLEPLPLPDPAGAGSPELARTADAVRLFLDRAALSAPGLVLDDADIAAVARIVRRLDGIPLALELVAGHVGLMPVAELQRHLDDRFLLSGRRGLAPRQRTLAATMDWSHDLLGDEERTLFRRLAVFGGSFSADAAGAVCAAGGASALALLHRLADASLVVGADRAGRYRLLETVRRYCMDLLRRHDEVEWTVRRHYAHYLSLAEEAAARVRGPDAPAWLARIDQEHDNLRAAFDCSGEREPRVALRLASTLELLRDAAAAAGAELTRWWASPT